MKKRVFLVIFAMLATGPAFALLGWMTASEASPQGVVQAVKSPPDAPHSASGASR